MDELHSKLRRLTENERISLIHDCLKRIGQLESGGNEEEKRLAKGAKRMLSERIDHILEQKRKAEALQKTVHLLFSLSDAGTLKVTLGKLMPRREYRVLAFNDLFSVGPIQDLNTREGELRRLSWFMDLDARYFHTIHANPENRLEAMADALRAIPDDKSVVIWYADNAHDQTGLRLALHLLKARKGPVNVVNTSEMFARLGCRLEDGSIPYAHGQIGLEQFLELVRRAGQGARLEADRRRQYESEWLELAAQDHTLRLWKDGAICGGGEEELDRFIVQSVAALREEQEEDGYIKAGSVVAKTMELSRQLVGDDYISYRIWSLINDGILDFKGHPGALYRYSVRLAVH